MQNGEHIIYDDKKIISVIQTSDVNYKIVGKLKYIKLEDYENNLIRNFNIKNGDIVISENEIDRLDYKQLYENEIIADLMAGGVI